MKCMEINKKSFTYKTYASKTEVLDGAMGTGEYTITYNTPVTAKGVIMPKTNKNSMEPFGVESDYDYSIKLDTTLPITKTTIITIDNIDYTVKSIIPTLNFTTITVKRVIE